MEKWMVVILVLALILAASVALVWLMRRAKNRFLQFTLGISGFMLGAISLLLLLIAAFFQYEEPPSISNLAKHFAERRSTLEVILAMSNHDLHFSRIDPTFINYGYIDGEPGGQSMAGSSESQLPATRWNAYRLLFSKAELDQGFTRDADGNVYFMAGSVGLLNRGHTTGYLYCRDPGSLASQSSGYEPCEVAKVDHSSQTYSNNPRREAYSFRKVADHWFVFDQGPS